MLCLYEKSVKQLLAICKIYISDYKVHRGDETFVLMHTFFLWLCSESTL